MFESCQLIEDTTQRPDVTLKVIRLRVPYFWGGIVGRSCLGCRKFVFEVFGHIQIPYFDVSIVEKYIRGLDVPVDDAAVMELGQTQ